jgi:hypothetical protein
MRLNYKKILLMLLSCTWAITSYANDKIVNIADFKKYEYEGEDATPMVREALAYCRKVKATKLIFPKGRYNFRRDYAVEKYVFMSNNDEGLKRFVFDLTGFKNFEIDGAGSEFVLNGFLSPFLISDAQNVCFRNFSIDYVRTFYSEGKILALTPEGMDIAFAKAFPYKIDHQTLLFTDTEGVIYPWSDLLEFDPVKRETAFMANDQWVGSNIPVKEIRPGIVRILSSEIKGTPGNVMVFTAGHRLISAFSITNSSSLSFHNINIYHCGGMGIVAQNSKDLVLDSVRVTPSPGSGRTISITADATHFINCSGKITIQNCLFENQTDDASNIHGIYSKVTRVISPYEIEVKLVHKQQFGFEYLKPHVTVEFADGPSIIIYAHNTVKSATILNKEYTRVVFRNPISSKTKRGDVIASTMGYPEVTIKNCVIRGNRARGLLLNSRGKTIVENNLFHVPGAAILFEGDASFWFEQSGVKNVLIRNNTFDNCNYGVWGTACIEVGTGIEKKMRSVSRYHQHIVIEHNTFKIFDPRILNAYCVDTLIFHDNHIERDNNYVTRFPDGRPFIIEHCSNVKIDNM